MSIEDWIDEEDLAMSDTETVEIIFTRKKAETSKAVLFRIDGAEHWIPKSKIISCDEDSRKLEIPEWLAIEKELV